MLTPFSSSSFDTVSGGNSRMTADHKLSYLFPTYTRWEVEPESASGSTMTDKNGKKYLDFTSGIGVCNLGHHPKNVEEAVLKQLNQYSL